ncbi:MAG: hydrogenase formation protein HypD [Thermoplasmata archaeon]
MGNELDQFKLRDRKVAKKIVRKIQDADVKMNVMHVCGTHQDTLVRYGLEEMLKDVGINIIQGPGCPVCVTTPREVEEMIKLAENGVTITAFGDMMKVPGEKKSLMHAKEEGADIRVVYGIDDAVEMAATSDKQVVFMSVGFETTTPSTASALARGAPDNFYVLTCNRVIPPALDAIMRMGELNLDGLIEPGHVSTIIGTTPYEPLSQRYHIPQVVAGFEPLDLLMGVYMLVRQVKEGRAEVENEYTRVVKTEGNPKARALVEEVFEPADVDWRGFPVIPDSGLKLRAEYQRHDTRVVFSHILDELKGKKFEEKENCLCGEVLRGITEPKECELFGKACTPVNPVGPCMVSREGSCNIAYRYRG